MKNKIFLLVLSVMALHANAQEAISSAAPDGKKGMVKIAILYPNGEGKTFDMDYYSGKHMPMCAQLFGESLRGLEINQGLAGRTPDEPVPYLAAGYFYFDTLEDYQKVFGPNAEKIVGDIPNYTNIQPIVQISKVLQ